MEWKRGRERQRWVHSVGRAINTRGRPPNADKPHHLRQRTLSSYLAHISSLSFAFPAWLFCTFIHLRSSYPTGRVSPLPSLPTQYTSLIQTIRREHPPFFSHPSPPLPLLAFASVFLSLIVPDLHSLVFRYPTSRRLCAFSDSSANIDLEGSVRT